MIVIAIIGIVLAMLVPSFGGMQRRARVRAGTFEMGYDLKQLRERALSLGQEFQVTRLNARQYQINHPSGRTSVYKLGGPTGGNITFGVSGAVAVVPPEANQVTPPAGGFDFNGGIIAFEARGGATKGVVYVTDGSQNYAIGVNSIGRVTTYQFQNGQWN
jgi:type II secretory pathway pseudopilin PulG